MQKEEKRFGQTKIGQFLKGLLKGAVREIPILGGAIDNMNSETGGKGKVVTNELTGQLIIGAIVLFGVLAAFGVLSEELVSQIITFLNGQ
jgi:hypothetical protein